MTSFTEIKQAIDQTAEAFEEFKKTNDQRIDALAKGKDGLAKELEAKLGRIESDIKVSTETKAAAERELQFLRDRVEELEAKGMSPGKGPQEKVMDEYKTAFMGWMRSRGQSQECESKMLDVARKATREFKDITIGTGSAGGYGVPEEISREIEKHELKFSPVRSLVKVVRAGTSDYKELLSINGATSGWVGETGTRSATTTPTLREITPTHGELYAYPQVSEWSLDDVFFNVESWLSESVGESFAVAEATSVLSGNGTNQPTGMLNSAPTAVSDETATRAAAVYEFIANVDAGLALLPDILIDTQYKLNSAYQMGAVWAMNSTTAGAVRKLKDQNDQYLWQPSMIVGQPDTLLGKPVTIWEQMATIANNAHPIAYGNFRRGYVIADRVGMRITRDSVTNIGHVRFYVRRREGGIVLNNNAIKFIKTTTA
ncbi:MAG: phage major capsid protein [Rubrivivax sp.]|nr:phage major capsid protein [Rubrivivax sp.]MDH5339055.1 phage major capsid protein [Rubrivivax sp.]